MLITNIKAPLTPDLLTAWVHAEACRQKCYASFTPAPSRSSVRVKLEFHRALDPHETTRRLSASGRKTCGVKWHVHKAFLEALFAAYPDLTVKTALVTYKGKASFDRDHGATYHHNGGSMMHPVSFGEL
jgi:hypothetical protein